MSIHHWGWNSYIEAVWKDSERGSTVPARVVAQGRGIWRVAGDFGECPAEAAGKLRLAAEKGADWPAVGDWVIVELRDHVLRDVVALLDLGLVRRDARNARHAAAGERGEHDNGESGAKHRAYNDSR